MTALLDAPRLADATELSAIAGRLVLVCGSRSWRWYKPILQRLEALQVGTVVIHGDAPRGADLLARMACKELRIPQLPFPADWSVKPSTPAFRVRRRRDGTLYDVGAGFERNRLMLDQEPELVIAFQRGGSSGTQDTIDGARRRGIEVEVHTA